MAMSCIRFSPIASLLAASLLCAGGPAYAAAPPDTPPLAGSPTGPWCRLLSWIVYFYYAGFPGRHNEAGRLKLAATGLATLRLDGFCSMHAYLPELTP